MIAKEYEHKKVELVRVAKPLYLNPKIFQYIAFVNDKGIKNMYFAVTL